MHNSFLLLLTFLFAGMCSLVYADVPKDTFAEMKWQYTYDAEDFLIKLSDPAGKETTFSYEFDNEEGILKRLVRQHSDGMKVIYELDSKGRCIKMTDALGDVLYEYDLLDRITGIKRNGLPQISYSYDSLDRITAIKLAKDLTIRYGYDFLDRLSRIETPAGIVSYVHLPGQGKSIRILPNEIRTIREYHPDGKLKSITHVEKENKIMAQFAYSYRPDGLISVIKEWNPRGEMAFQYEYDKVQRLIAVTDSSGKKIQYQYDKLGNRTALIVNGQKENVNKFNWAGQMVSHNGQACNHDTYGNLTSFTGKNGQCHFEYNAIGSVKAAKLNDLSVNYEYDGDGYLIARTIGKKKTLYLPDPLTDNWSPLFAIDSDEKKTFYIWDDQSPLMAIKGKDVKFFLNDHLGSVRCVVDKKGQVVNQYDYSPFGMPSHEITGTDLIPGFAGLFFDGSISIYLTRARTYDSQKGQFLQTDPQHRIPFCSQKDLSSYAYCGGDPVNYVDRNGYAPQRVDLYFDAKKLECVRNEYLYSHTVPIRTFSFSDVKVPSLVQKFNSASKGRLKDLLVEAPFNQQTPYPSVYAANKMFSGMGTIAGITDYVNTAIAHPGDPATVMKQASLYLKVASGLGVPVVGGIANLADLTTEVGNAIRSRTIQNRALGLVGLPLGERMAPDVWQVLHKDWGDFTMKSRTGDFNANGGWSLSHSMPDNTPLWQFWKRSSHSNHWAKYDLTKYNLHNGTRISGDFGAGQRRTESAGASYRVTTNYSRVHYSYDGAAVSKAVEEYNRTGVYDLKKWQNNVSQAQEQVSHKMLIDIPGVNWKGSVRDNDWGAMLEKNKTTIYIRHEGLGKDDWAKPEPDAIIVTLPNKWDVKSANKQLLPHIKSALSQNKDAHFVIDMNITFSRHILPFPKMSENQWAANVSDYIAEHKAKNHKIILAEHSRGTDTNKYIRDFSKYDTVVIASPRGDDALSWIKKNDVLPKTYIITGLSDAPAWRWGERLGKLVKRSDVHIIQLQNLSKPSSTHSSLQNIETQGTWKQINNTGENVLNCKLRDIISPAFHSKRSVQSSDKFPSSLSSRQQVKMPRPPYRRGNEYLPDIKYGNFWGGDDGGPGGGGFSPMSPTNVGGVYLKDAGKALEHLGQLNGIAIDEKSGELILISEQDGEIGLPPLRIDDVVTVFKSVYELGESPFVSIDPKPEDPQGPIMNIRHGKGTEETYVGWVLFETDRVMKGYSLGVDNITREKIKSEIEDYKSVFDMTSNDEDGQKEGDPIWERFWIVPAEVNAHKTDNKELTLFDVPLKVNTQRMKMRKGKLVPADNPTPTENAKIFSEWFTKKYDKIAAEFTSKPPSGSGIDKPVECFAELRRIAVITAIAESLRDQGVPMPAWMYDYPVKSCEMPKTTPAIRIEKAQETIKDNVIETRRHLMYGGVNLAAEEKDVHILKADRKVETLADEIQKEVTSVPVLTPVKITSNNKEHNAVALPGNDTLDIGANQLAETDLVVPVMRDMEILLVRKYNSFFAPDSIFGKGWTLDLPRLKECRQPSGRSSDVVTYSIGYQLTSPLNTYSELFRIRRDAAGVEKSKSLLPEKQNVFRGVAQMNDVKIGFETTVLMFQDGRQWHFDDSGYLVAQVDNTSTVVYRRTGSHHITRIEGWYGKDLYADIKLNYDKQDRIVSAKGSNEKRVEYEYGNSGELRKVTFVSDKDIDKQKPQKDIIGYEYTNGLVTSVAWNGENIRQFEYSDRGRLSSEKGAGSKLDYHVSHNSDGIKIVSQNDNVSQTAVYDNKFRPVEKVDWDGTTVKWNYDDPAVIKLKLTQPGGEQYFIENSTDGKHSTVRTPRGDNYSVEYDEASRPVLLSQDGRQLIKQQWHPNGLPSSTFTETYAIHPEYSDDNVRTGILITPPEKRSKYDQWLHIDYDQKGRPEKVTDYSGEDILFAYDKDGEVASVQSRQGGIQYKRDKEGRLTKMETSWGYCQEAVYDAKSGVIKQLKLRQGKEDADIRFDQGRPSSLWQFDGGKTDISYFDSVPNEGQVKEIRMPNDVTLTYNYDPANRLARVNCGTYELKFTYDEQGRLVSLARLPVNE